MPRRHKLVSPAQRAVLVRMATTGDYISEHSGSGYYGLRQWRSATGGWFPHFKGHEAPNVSTLVALRSLGLLVRHIDGRDYSYHITDAGRAAATAGNKKGAPTRAGTPSSQEGPRNNNKGT